MIYKKISYIKNPAPANSIDSLFSSEKCNSERLAISSNLRLQLIFFHGTEFRVGFSSAEWFGTEFQVFCFYFCFTVQNSKHLAPPEWFGTEFREFPVPRNSRNSAGTNQLFRQFRLPRNNFLSEIANPIFTNSSYGFHTCRPPRLQSP